MLVPAKLCSIALIIAAALLGAGCVYSRQPFYTPANLRTSKALVGVYERLRAFAPARRALLAVGPFFHVFARKVE